MERDSRDSTKATSWHIESSPLLIKKMTKEENVLISSLFVDSSRLVVLLISFSNQTEKISMMEGPPPAAALFVDLS